MKKILIASDSFKGTLSSVEIGKAFKKQYRNTEIVSVSDGGEGFVESLLFNNKDFKAKTVVTIDDMEVPVRVRIAIRGTDAYIEAASVIALHNHPKHKACEKVTTGIGILLNKLESSKTIKNVYIGLGGSSTTDMGFYASLAMGFKYPDKDGKEITRLEKIEKAVAVIRPKLSNRYIGLADIENRLYGNQGALKIFGRQKGLTNTQIVKYERYFKHITKLVNKDAAKIARTGAAGGLGYFIVGNLGGQIRSGIKEVLKLSKFRQMAKTADYVITGEGAFDNQSFFGKAPYAIANLAGKDKVILIAGVILVSKKKILPLCKDCFQLKPDSQSEKEAIKKSSANLRRVIAEIKHKYLD